MDYKEKVIALLNSQELSKEQIEKLESIFPELKESEDERIRKEIVELVMQPTWKTEKEFHRRNELCTWLEKQGVQKPANCLQELGDKLANATPKQLAEWKEKYFKEEPAEWSEEDERMYRGLHNLIYSTPYCDSRKEFSDWLKSLKDRVQPQQRQEWKPSDEQIKGIECAIKTLQHQLNVGDKRLDSLYADLKKLREE